MLFYVLLFLKQYSSYKRDPRQTPWYTLSLSQASLSPSQEFNQTISMLIPVFNDKKFV